MSVHSTVSDDDRPELFIDILVPTFGEGEGFV